MSLEDVRNAGAQIEKIVEKIQRDKADPKLRLSALVELIREKQLISEESFMQPNRLSMTDEQAWTSRETYENLFEIENLVCKRLEPESEDVHNLTTLISSQSVQVKFLGVLCLRMTIYKFANMLQGDLFHNKDFVGAMIASMISDRNVLL